MRTWTFAIVAGLAVTGCKKESKETAPAPASALPSGAAAGGAGSAPARAGIPAPTPGAISVVQMVGVTKEVTQGTPWEEGLAAAVARLGAPMQVEGPRSGW